ncbi:MAG TPA: hypothetical protein VHJ20_08820 [Polyangia bacterium]|nr:hypothetical protein [Polyangia bacterium]
MSRRSSRHTFEDPAARVGALATAIERHLPLRPEEVPAVLAAIGAPVRDVDELVLFFKDTGRAAPFRFVRRGGAQILVAPTALAASEAVLMEASHLVFHWGLCTVEMIGERLGSLAKPTLPDVAVARVLASIPRLRWLDDARRWFSFVGSRSRMRAAVGKVFGVFNVVALADLTAALGKRLKALELAPHTAIRTYLSQVAGCELDGDVVRAGAGLARAPLDRGERAVVDLIASHGGVLARGKLHHLAEAAGLRLAAVRQIILTSPLVLANDLELRLVGA